jgi:hypothetical protein
MPRKTSLKVISRSTKIPALASHKESAGVALNSAAPQI